jgi:ribosomal protein S18 acetylase RimI-like enzyme
MEKVRDYAKRNVYQCVVLWVWEGNKRVVQFYQRAGYFLMDIQ